MTMDEHRLATDRIDAGAMTLHLLNGRAEHATICPSEVARALVPTGGWRGAMPLVHAAIDQLVKEGRVTLSWKGKPLSTRTGPYRIARAT